MAKEKLPKLTETQIKAMASEQSFARGRSYYNDGAILNPRRQGMELSAECQGSDYELYQIRVSLDAKGVADSECDCPYEYGGICKHLVALLLTYVREPQAFRITQQLEQAFADKSKEELIAIITAMVRREPKLLSEVELAAATQQAKPGKPADTAVYQRQVRRVMGYDSPRIIEKELKSLRDTAARLLKAGDALNAGAVYHTVIVEAVNGYDDLVMSMDEDGDIAIVIDEIAQGLGEALKKSKPDAATRKTWLEALLEAELKDIELGGIDLAPSTRNIITRQATAEDWQWMEERLRKEIQLSRDWGREALVSFLSEGLKRAGRKGETAALIREMGTEEQQVHLLVKEKRIAEATSRMQAILKTKPGLLTEFADALVQAKADDAAIRLVKGQEKRWQSREWLATYYRERGTPEQALAAQRELFFDSPSLEKFKTLREVSAKLKDWEQTRAGALKRLERDKQFGMLIEIALHEDDVACALAVLPQVKGGWRDYKLEVAKAAEKDFPQEAITIYKDKAQRAINERSRNSYATAAGYLKRVKTLYQRIGASREWDSTIQALRTQYANLPALQDELSKAKL
jgi:uncharacterized Zn finger protein